MDQNVSARVALQVMEEQKQFPGVTAQVQPVIDYPQPDGANPAQVLGYLQPITPQEITSRHLPVTGFSGVDLVGQAGLEAQYDSQLRGKAGPRWCRSTPRATSPAPSARPRRSTATTS